MQSKSACSYSEDSLFHDVNVLQCMCQLESPEIRVTKSSRKILAGAKLNILKMWR